MKEIRSDMLPDSERYNSVKRVGTFIPKPGHELILPEGMYYSSTFFHLGILFL